jgi:hypothetical protein
MACVVDYLFFSAPEINAAVAGSQRGTARPWDGLEHGFRLASPSSRSALPVVELRRDVHQPDAALVSCESRPLSAAPIFDEVLDGFRGTGGAQADPHVVAAFHQLPGDMGAKNPLAPITNFLPPAMG